MSLVIEDDRSIRLMMQRLIERRYPSVRVYAAGDGREALMICDQVLPALIISDIMMPNLDGLGFIAELRTRGITSPVIALTSNDLLKAQAPTAGATLFFSQDGLH